MRFGAPIEKKGCESSSHTLKATSEGERELKAFTLLTNNAEICCEKFNGKLAPSLLVPNSSSTENLNKDGSDPHVGKDKSLIECVSKFIKVKKLDKQGKRIFEFEDQCEEEFDDCEELHD